MLNLRQAGQPLDLAVRAISGVRHDKNASTFHLAAQAGRRRHVQDAAAADPRANATHAWHEATWQCCSPKSRVRGANGIVVDVGGNFGWYTLCSLALGRSVIVFEPIPAYQEVLMLGVSLNPASASV